MTRAFFLALTLAILPLSAWAQGASIAFGSTEHDSSQPVEIAADQLAIDQNTGNATFSGNVVIGQGTLRIAASKVEVEYESGGGDVKEMRATGGVTVTNGVEDAESAQAIYMPQSGQMVMTGNVILTQGRNALAGEKLVVNLDAGTGVMEGRVRSIFVQDGN